MLEQTIPTTLPATPEDVAAIFATLRDTPSTAHHLSEMMPRIHHLVSTKLNTKYGHEHPVEWYDHPEATILAVGEAAADRISRDQTTTTTHLSQWKHALRAYALCIEPEMCQPMLKALDVASPDINPPFTGE